MGTHLADTVGNHQVGQDIFYVSFVDLGKRNITHIQEEIFIKILVSVVVK